jgi:apolipoprotein N-acyltransferase
MHTLKTARLGAIENGYALIHTAYHAQSAAFDRPGNALATQGTTGLPRHIIYADVPAKGSPTLHNRAGDVLGGLSFAGLLADIAAALVRPRRTEALPKG